MSKAVVLVVKVLTCVSSLKRAGEMDAGFHNECGVRAKVLEDYTILCCRSIGQCDERKIRAYRWVTFKKWISSRGAGILA